MPATPSCVAKTRADIVRQVVAAGWQSQPTVLETLFVFALGEKRLWNCPSARLWVCADLTGDGSSIAIDYRNHRRYDDLESALLGEAARG